MKAGCGATVPTDEEYRLTAELPGLEERGVEVLLQEWVLTAV
jgi:HSP20 family molecular chaperone IbpA